MYRLQITTTCSCLQEFYMLVLDLDVLKYYGYTENSKTKVINKDRELKRRILTRSWDTYDKITLTYTTDRLW